MICKKCEADLIEKCTRCGEPLSRKQFPNDMINEFYKNNGTGKVPCMHENCSGCKNGTCSGVHMMSCPCPKCSPRML